ncbi:MAG: flagellar hook protein FlgE [Alphaproteobacteria bacterium]|nr:flagellar hook protein FlgE [Alphaproteobacteria bacterium]
MALFSAMTASVSGLGAQGQAISVISDNLANTNTIGYKSSRSLFSQLVTTGAQGTTYNSGGVNTAVLRDQTAQGSFITSSSRTDLAISGNGFFRVADDKVNSTSTEFFFTRAGSFSEDREGYLVNPDGYYLQGWRTDSAGNILDIQEPEAVELQSVGVSAQQTRELSMDANLTSTRALNQNYDTTGTKLASINGMIANPTRFDYLTDLRVYDSQGGARDLTIGFSKRGANAWDYTIYTDGSNLQSGVAGTNTLVATGELRFTQSGALKFVTPNNFSATWAGGVATSTVNLDFGQYVGGNIATPSGTVPASYANHILDVSVENNAFGTGQYTLVKTTVPNYELRAGNGTAGAVVESGIAQISASGTREIYFPTSGVRFTVSTNFDETTPGVATAMATFTVTSEAQLEDGLGNDGITQLAASFNTSAINQDGFGAGTLSAIQVDDNGFINGTFTNGETKKLYKVVVAVFQNPRGLEAVSGSLLRTTDASGQPLLKEAGVGGTGRIVSGALEGSTTDIAGEFSNMIVVQRAFQASSKVITTVDQMLNELLQLR